MINRSTEREEYPATINVARTPSSISLRPGNVIETEIVSQPEILAVEDDEDLHLDVLFNNEADEDNPGNEPEETPDPSTDNDPQKKPKDTIRSIGQALGFSLGMGMGFPLFYKLNESYPFSDIGTTKKLNLISFPIAFYRAETPFALAGLCANNLAALGATFDFLYSLRHLPKLDRKEIFKLLADANLGKIGHVIGTAFGIGMATYFLIQNINDPTLTFEIPWGAEKYLPVNFVRVITFPLIIGSSANLLFYVHVGLRHGIFAALHIISHGKKGSKAAAKKVSEFLTKGRGDPANDTNPPNTDTREEVQNEILENPPSRESDDQNEIILNLDGDNNSTSTETELDESTNSDEGGGKKAIHWLYEHITIQKTFEVVSVSLGIALIPKLINNLIPSDYAYSFLSTALANSVSSIGFWGPVATFASIGTFVNLYSATGSTLATIKNTIMNPPTSLKKLKEYVLSISPTNVGHVVFAALGTAEVIVFIYNNVNHPDARFDLPFGTDRALSDLFLQINAVPFIIGGSANLGGHLVSGAANTVKGTYELAKGTFNFGKKILNKFGFFKSTENTETEPAPEEVEVNTVQNNI